MRRRVFGEPLYTARPGRGVQRPRSVAPSHSTRYVWSVGSQFVLVSWSRYKGFTPVEVFRVVGGLAVDRRPFLYPTRCPVKKPSAAAPAAPDPGQPTPTSAVLKKFPRLIAFLADRFYENGEPRWPGSLWLDSDAMAFRALLKEPSLFLQARIRAATLDDLLAAIETFLGLDAAPWEPDTYAQEKAAPKKKK